MCYNKKLKLGAYTNRRPETEEAYPFEQKNGPFSQDEQRPVCHLSGGVYRGGDPDFPAAGDRRGGGRRARLLHRPLAPRRRAAAAVHVRLRTMRYQHIALFQCFHLFRG